MDEPGGKRVIISGAKGLLMNACTQAWPRRALGRRTVRHNVQQLCEICHVSLDFS